MAFGISPRYIQEVTFEKLSQEQLLVFGLETIKKLKWNIGYTGTNGIIAYTKISWSSWSEEVTMRIDGQKVTLKSECIGSQLVDWGKNKQNIETFLRTFQGISDSISPEDASARYREIKVSNEMKDDLLNQPPLTSRDKIKNVASIFIPTEGYFVTPIILNLNILVFILMVAGGAGFWLPTNESLIAWGANFRPVTLEGQWWRLLTCCFVHIGIFHLLMNLYALTYIGLLLEPQLGKERFLSAYLLSGIAGSALSLYWHELTISAGASGAIFGMYGVFLAMLTTNLIEKSARRTMLTSIGIFVAYNLLNGMKGGIDNAAHIGGLLAGVVIGYSYYPSLTRPAESGIKYQTIVLLIIPIFLLSFFVYHQTPNDIPKYDAKMEKFASLESLAMETYQQNGNTPKAELLAEIKERGIYYWKQSIQIVNEADRLNIPRELHARNKKLKEYCELRIKTYELVYKAIDEESDQYEEQIKEYNKRIEQIIDELRGGI